MAGLSGAVALLAAAVVLFSGSWTHGIQALQIGSWPAPYGITLVADLFAAIMVLLAGLMGLAVAVYSLASMDRGRETSATTPCCTSCWPGCAARF